MKHNEGKTDKASKMALLMRMMIIIPVLTACLLTVAFLVDPFGNFCVYDYITARVIADAQSNISCFADLVMMFYCVDVYNAFSKSNAMQKFTPFLMKHRIGGFIILGFGGSMVVFGSTLNYLSLTGVVGDPTNSSVVAALYGIFVNIVTAIVLIVLSHKIKKEVMVIATKDAQKAATKAAEAKKKADMASAYYAKKVAEAAKTGGPMPKEPKPVIPQEVKVNPAVVTTMKTRRFMLIGAAFRLIPLVGSVMGISGVMYTSPFMFGMAVWGFMILPRIISSTVMVLLVIEITPNTRHTLVTSVSSTSKRASTLMRRLSGTSSAGSSTGPARSTVVSAANK